MIKIGVQDNSPGRRNRDLFEDKFGGLWRLFEPGEGWQVDVSTAADGYLLRRVLDGRPEQMHLSTYLASRNVELGIYNSLVYERLTPEVFCEIFQQSQDHFLTVMKMDLGGVCQVVYRGIFQGRTYELLTLVPLEPEAGKPRG